MTGDPVSYQNWGRTVHPHNHMRIQYDLIQTQNNWSDFVTGAQFLSSNPQLNSTHLVCDCSAMLLNNILNPEWITIECNQALMKSVMCAVPQNSSVNEEMLIPLEVCNSECIAMNTSCFKFLWPNGVNKHVCRLRKNFISEKQRKELLDAVFPEIQRGGYELSSLLQFESLLTTVQNIQICKESRQSTIFGTNVFTCKNKVLILSSSVCDGRNDCPSVDDSDEVNCTCNDHIYSSPCKYVARENETTCSIFFYTTHSKQCLPYMIESAEDKALTTNCLHKDCTGKRPADSHKSKEDTMVSQSGKDKCLSGFLPCQMDTGICFQIKDVCVYKLNTFNTLTPCKFGEHMTGCKAFQCNKMFKCPNFYCIPWHYCCDGKWDCPLGIDENKCKSQSWCAHLLKCWGSQICTHTGNLCDGSVDCPLKDDEQLCALNAKACPLLCQCMLFTLLCYNNTEQKILNLQDNYFHAIFMESSTVELSVFNYQFTQLIILSLKSCNLTDLCSLKVSGLVLTVIDTSFNKATSLKVKCFSYATKAKVIVLKDNKIRNVAMSPFFKLTKLTFVDLSKNELGQINTDMFEHSRTLKILNLEHSVDSNSTISGEFLSGVKLKVLRATEYGLCCLAEETVSCQTATPIQTTCSLLPNVALKIVSGLVIFCTICTNGVSIFVRIFSFVKKYDKSAAFLISILAINFTDVLCGLHLLILWVSDIIYKEQMALEGKIFKSGVACFTAFSFQVANMLLSPFALVFLSLSRLGLVANPVTTKFKKASFVAKWTSVMITTIFLLTCTITLSTKFVYMCAPTLLCSLFTDPANTHTLSTFSIVFLTLLIQIVALVCIVVTYLKMALELSASAKLLAGSVSKERSYKRTYTQLVITTASSLLSWIPFSGVAVHSLFAKQDLTEIMLWVTITCASLSSISNPVMFVVTSKWK